MTLVVVDTDVASAFIRAKQPSPESEWWNTSDVAAFLGVKVGTVSAYRLRGQMPAPDLTVGRTHMWRPARILEWHGDRPRPGVGGRPVSDVEAEVVAERDVEAGNTEWRVHGRRWP